MQARAGLVDDARAVGRIVTPHLPVGARGFLAHQRLAVASSLDPTGRVWASLLTGPEGFAKALGEREISLAGLPIPGDPLGPNLIARPELGLLVLDPATRRRMRFNGTGRLESDGIALLVRQAYGNCPKYIQRRRLLGEDRTTPPQPPIVSSRLSPIHQAAIASADTLFLATFHPEGGADASHRGGFPGFLRALGEDRLAFDDYPGNGMFNSLGNLLQYPSVGLLLVDFEQGHLLQLTGRATIRRDFSLVVDLEEVRETLSGSPLRFEFVDYSPANPRVSRESSLSIPRSANGIGGQEENGVAKEIACNDVVGGCALKATAETEKELLEKVEAHASHAHGVTEVTPELAKKVKAAIRSR
jgi:predicted pyridoxine 5'-phosphate oxidase superfamily flavin-nucleotide-binding protein/predicted small metal-binding protein